MQPTDSKPCFKYGSNRRLLAAALDFARPPRAIATADYAAANRILPSGAKWSHARAPYTPAMMDALDSPDFLTVAIVGPGQVAKTAIVENWHLRNIHHDPADVLHYMHTDAAIQDYVKQVVNPMIDAHREVRNLRGRQRSDNSLSFKRFTGMTARFFSFSPGNIVNKTARRVIADEFDAYDESVGDPETVLNIRRTSYGATSKLVVISHPDRAGGNRPEDWNRGVMSVYRKSNRHVWWWPCPHCGMWSSPNPGTRFQTVLTFNGDADLDDIQEHAHLLCPHNGCIIADTDRVVMNALGKWVGAGQVIDEASGDIGGELVPNTIAGFWIVGVMSSFIIGGIGGLARALAQAQRTAIMDRDDTTLRTVTCKSLGLPYVPARAAQSVSAEVLADRADAALQRGQVPDWVRFITASVDVQANRFETLFRGWGVQRESIIIDFRVLDAASFGAPVDPATDPRAWDEALKQASQAEFPLADGSHRVMRVLAAGVDSSAFTDQAYAAWDRARRAGQAKFRGITSGRKVYNLLCLKGASALQAQTLVVTQPDQQGSSRGAVRRGEMPLGVFNPNSFKDVLSNQLCRAELGPGYVHLPGWLRAPKPPHAWFEQLVAEQKTKGGRWEKIKDHARNEALDLMVMSAVMCHLWAPGKFDWTMARVPNWAAPHDQNPLVGTPTAGEHAAPDSLARDTVQAPLAAAPAVPSPPAALRPANVPPAGTSRLAQARASLLAASLQASAS